MNKLLIDKCPICDSPLFLDFDFGRISFIKGMVQDAQLFTCAGTMPQPFDHKKEKHRIAARKRIGKEVETFNRTYEKNRWIHIVFKDRKPYAVEP